MAKKDWEKLAGEKGERVKSSKFERVLRLGSVGATAAASSIAGKLRSVLTGQPEDDDALSAVYSMNADRIAGVLGQLKGASMKVGQMLSADPEVIPAEFAESFATLQRDAPPMTWTTVVEVIETALDRPMEQVFSYFDPEPVGAASIGQVHRATLGTGEDVAVKIQYPGVTEALESDLDTLKSMLVWGRPFATKERLDSYFDEIHDVLMSEADYLQEATNLERFQVLLAGRDDLVAPKPFRQWTHKNVLVMEYMEGTKLDEALAAMDSDDCDETLQRWVSLFTWMVLDLQELHADPHPGNFLVQEDGRLALLDFGCFRPIDPKYTDGLLKLLASVWDDEPERSVEVLEELGYGGELRSVDPELVLGYLEIVLAPFLCDGEFAFGGWTPATDGERYGMAHPSLYRVTPPTEMLLLFRILSGIKGLLSKFDAHLDIRTPVWTAAEQRGIV